MVVAEQSELVAVFALVLYFALPVWPFAKGHIILGGALMLFAAFIPLLWQFNLTDSDAKGFAILFVLLAPIPMLLIAIGMARGTARMIRAMLKRRKLG